MSFLPPPVQPPPGSPKMNMLALYSGACVLATIFVVWKLDGPFKLVGVLTGLAAIALFVAAARAGSEV